MTICCTFGSDVVCQNYNKKHSCLLFLYWEDKIFKIRMLYVKILHWMLRELEKIIFISIYKSKNWYFFSSEETPKGKTPSPQNSRRPFLVTKSICESSLSESVFGVFIFNRDMQKHVYKLVQSLSSDFSIHELYGVFNRVFPVFMVCSIAYFTIKLLHTFPCISEASLQDWKQPFETLKTEARVYLNFGHFTIKFLSN